MDSTAKPGRMSVDEYLAWAETVPGRYELVDGEVVAMSPERVVDGRSKYRVQKALEAGVARAGLPCEMLPDGMTVRVDDRTAFEPDALVHCSERIDPDSVEVPEPVIVVEIVSPGTRSVDTGRKALGYIAVPSIAHYLIVVSDKRTVIHHRRVAPDRFETSLVRGGVIALDPPGITIAWDDVFGPPSP